MHYLLFYDVAKDYMERRAALRSEHLKYAWAAVERGEIVLGGAVGEPAESALILFRGESPAAAEAFARSDPYVKGGVVEKWRVRPWNTVVGEDAVKPTRG